MTDETFDTETPLWIHPTAFISPDARIHASTRGTKIRIGAHSFVHDFVVLRAVGGEGDIIIGEHCYLNPNTTVYSGNGVFLDDYVLIAPGCVIAASNHAFGELDTPMRLQGFTPSRGGVHIERDVWVGANSVLLDGTLIGTGAIITAGSIVSGEVEPYGIYGGNPARKIDTRNRP